MSKRTLKDFWKAGPSDPANSASACDDEPKRARGDDAEKRDDPSSSAPLESTCSVASATTSTVHPVVVQSSHRELYKGMPLDISALCRASPCLKPYTVKEGGRNRRYVKCTVCEEQVETAKKHSRNASCPIATGIRADDVLRVQSVIDHLLSKAHSACLEATRLQELYRAKNVSHPWLKLCSSVKVDTLKMLTELAVDVYNDSLYKTLTAHNWPARSLAAMHAQQICLDFSEPFAPFSPSASEFHYRDPVYYAEMLDVVGHLEKEKMLTTVKKAVAVSIQVDGSADRQMRDNKFVTCRAVLDNLSVQPFFLSAEVSETSGAEGLLEATMSAIQGIPAEKIVGICTDGEAANTGKNAGLWKLLSEKLNKSLVTIWCVGHRSDLALEAVINNVPELKIWKSNLKSVATYYRTSTTRQKKVTQLGAKFAFPAFFEVRFAEHLHNLIHAVLGNMEAMMEHWTQLSNSTDKRDKNEAIGFINTWKEGEAQLFITAVMGDVCRIFQQLQKSYQASDLMLTDVFEAKDSAVRKLRLILAQPFPGGFEEKFAAANSNDDDIEDAAIAEISQRPRRSVMNSLIPSLRARSVRAIRLEILQSAINFLEARLDLEQESFVSTVFSCLSSGDLHDFIAKCRVLLDQVASSNQGAEETQRFADDACEKWLKINPIIASSNTASQKLVCIAKECGTGSAVGKLFCSIMAICPHSMIVERAVSAHNQFRSIHRLSMSSETVKNRLHIALNAVGTAFYDPRPAVVHFLEKRERRDRRPSSDTYKNRDFIRKFFRESPNI
jgi:hypothetical protein